MGRTGAVADIHRLFFVTHSPREYSTLHAVARPTLPVPEEHDASPSQSPGATSGPRPDAPARRQSAETGGVPAAHAAGRPGGRRHAATQRVVAPALGPTHRPRRFSREPGPSPR